MLGHEALNAPERPSPQFYVNTFLPDGPEAIARFIEAVRPRRERVVQEWHAACSLRGGAHRAISDELFQQTYGPELQDAVSSLIHGDTAGFASVAASLGEQLAAGGVPFAAMVAHLNLWKESCTKALVDNPEHLCSTLLLMDQLLCCFISAAADGYYGRAKSDALRPQNESAAEVGPVSPPDGFHGLIGRSPAMREIVEQVRWIARGIDPVLILGETGTGKELVAQAIHREGPRHGRPFIGVNCAALPRELIESELFGYKRGAFSGALTDHVGLFRAAAGGTLLLDEIAEMSADLQAKLLRVLQERVVRPVGSVAEVPVDVRIIASTNRDPAAALASGVLRSDLYYRLCGSAIVLAPLRARAEDIVPLVEHRLSVLNARYRRSGPTWRGVTPEAMRELTARPWLGNVRELFNALESAFTSRSSSHIEVADIGRAFATVTVLGGASMEPFPAPPRPAELATFAESERGLIALALTSTRGNKLLAARLLGISRKTLYAKIAKYGVTNEPGTPIGADASGQTPRSNRSAL